jgi:hypothetical protein
MFSFLNLSNFVHPFTDLEHFISASSVFNILPSLIPKLQYRTLAQGQPLLYKMSSLFFHHFLFNVLVKVPHIFWNF